MDHEALVAEGADTGEPIGVARYVRLVDDPDNAEVAVTVVDRWQHKGVASELLLLLGRPAVENGIRRFSGPRTTPACSEWPCAGPPRGA